MVTLRRFYFTARTVGSEALNQTKQYFEAWHLLQTNNMRQLPAFIKAQSSFMSDES